MKGKTKSKAKKSEELSKKPEGPKTQEKIKPLVKKTKVAPISTVKEGQIFEQTVNGQKLVFKLIQGEMILQNTSQLRRADGKRAFCLRPIPLREKKYRTNKRYWLRPKKEGARMLRFSTANFEGEKRERSKERVILIEDQDTIRDLVSMPSIFEEIYDHEPGKGAPE